jgi:hypothetical protein
MSESISPQPAVEIALYEATVAGFELAHGSGNDRGITITCPGCGAAVTVPVMSRRTEMTARRVDVFVDAHRSHGGQ